ncbi:MAG: ferrous iron transport protein B [Planctomycetes bacterium]|nr:ferrous iron transport protein B [Planctomycetota bacterium]
MTEARPAGESTRNLRRDKHVVALLGNPNTGKSTLFTALTGTRQKIANYPGVTVEAKVGHMQFENTELTVIDLPGTYSLAARSPDERVATEALLGRLDETPKPDGVILVVDASSLDRNLYLATQVLEFGLPSVIALTMVDVAKTRGITIDLEKLSRAIGCPVVAVNAPKGEGLHELKATLHKRLHHPAAPLSLEFPPEFVSAVDALHLKLADLGVTLGYTPTRPEALRLIVDAAGPLFEEAHEAGGSAFDEEFSKLRTQACGGKSAALIEAQARYGRISAWTREARTQEKIEGRTLTDRVDSILTHRLWGTLVFILVMGVIFQSIYTWASPLMDLIESGTKWVGDLVGSNMADGPLKGLIVDGVIGGAGGVLVFLPQILILFLFIAILEDLGYMSRAAFLMDRLMSRFGLTGRSFIPLLSSFACAIPGIMGARVIEDRNTRLTTIFLAPFMSCSARLPVYTVMIAAFVPDQKVLGFVSVQGLTLFAMYWVGVLAAIPTAIVLKKGILKSKITPFLLELPSYKMPRPKAIALTLFEKGGAFVKRAGTIILAVSVIVWALSYFPHSQEITDKWESEREKSSYPLKTGSKLVGEFGVGIYTFEAAAKLPEFQKALAEYKLIGVRYSERIAQIEGELEEGQREREIARAGEIRAEAYTGLQRDLGRYKFLAISEYADAEIWRDERLAEIDSAEAGEHLRNSYMGRMGRTIEPAVKPLGWDWRIAMAAIASFPAREVVIGTLGTIFNLSDADETSEPLRETLQKAKREGSDEKLFSLATGLSVMVFFALCCQCAATLAVMRRETNSWRWPLASFLYMTTLAYFGALVTYQIAHALGG